MLSLELPPDPAIRNDLIRVVRKVTHAGVIFHLPRTADGRHCDYVPALVHAIMNAPDMPLALDDPGDKMLEDAIRKVDEKLSEDYWEGALLRVAG